eukprot:CAMPEP_0174246628 /NCGR_PEP_ID=MMETSP0417-20130205/42166_1 /TAXON_ID=242541 /ORGANISM="Mayorella sp, Strain BSH-02190019" /LENGTH=679 /DNA_ID=CAMNT_0015326481 /DNA_START=759 /DNA_END=2798 /DNA_ORIENTATION=-
MHREIREPASSCSSVGEHSAVHAAPREVRLSPYGNDSAPSSPSLSDSASPNAAAAPPPSDPSSSTTNEMAFSPGTSRVPPVAYPSSARMSSSHAQQSSSPSQSYHTVANQSHMQQQQQQDSQTYQQQQQQQNMINQRHQQRQMRHQQDAHHHSGSGAGGTGASPHTNPRYKTMLCRSWLRDGQCSYGRMCQFAHGEQELRPMPRHPKYRTETCRSFTLTGMCPYGARCAFIHQPVGLSTRIIPTAASSTVSSTAVAYQPQADTQSAGTLQGASPVHVQTEQPRQAHSYSTHPASDLHVPAQRPVATSAVAYPPPQQQQQQQQQQQLYPVSQYEYGVPAMMLPLHAPHPPRQQAHTMLHPTAVHHHQAQMSVYSQHQVMPYSQHPVQQHQQHQQHRQAQRQTEQRQGASRARDGLVSVSAALSRGFASLGLGDRETQPISGGSAPPGMTVLTSAPELPQHCQPQPKPDEPTLAASDPWPLLHATVDRSAAANAGATHQRASSVGVASSSDRKEPETGAQTTAFSPLDHHPPKEPTDRATVTHSGSQPSLTRTPAWPLSEQQQQQQQRSSTPLSSSPSSPSHYELDALSSVPIPISSSAPTVHMVRPVKSASDLDLDLDMDRVHSRARSRSTANMAAAPGSPADSPLSPIGSRLAFFSRLTHDDESSGVISASTEQKESNA